MWQLQKLRFATSPECYAWPALSGWKNLAIAFHCAGRTPLTFSKRRSRVG